MGDRLVTQSAVLGPKESIWDRVVGWEEELQWVLEHRHSDNDEESRG